MALALTIITIIVVSVIILLIVKLRRQRQEYQTLFESVPCTITVQDKDFRIVGYNREFADLFNPTVGDYCYQVYKGRDQKCEICPVERTFQDGKTHTSEETRTNQNGTRKHWIVKTAPVTNAQGEIVAAIEMCLDVTARKMLEDELERSEKKYYAIFDNIPNPVLVLDPETYEVLDGNKSIESVYGYPKDAVLGKSFLDFFTAEERKHFEFKLKNAEPINQVKQIGRSGKTLYVNIRVSPSEYWGQQVLLVAVSDITKRLEAEQQLSQASKLATLGEMATGVAHELNQPLTVIKMASGFLTKKIQQKEPIPPEILTNMAEKINNNVERANKIINHMRDFARKSDLTLEKIGVNRVLEQAYDIFSQQLKLRKIEVIWNLNENLPPIMGDAGRLEQVFINLLVNARDAIEKRWEEEDAAALNKRIFITTDTRNGQVFVEVCDTGTGISKGVREKIFEPFFTTKEVGKGTGLGLSISYGIIKDFRGQIQVKSHPEGGACFQLEFPIPQPSDKKDVSNGR